MVDTPSRAPERRDRQVLVVGDGLVAGATAGFLDQAGLDPVLATAANGRTRPRVVTLWEPGLALLARIGLRRPVERLGTPLNRLDAGDAWAARDRDRSPLLALERQRCRRVLDHYLLDRLRSLDRSVTAVEPTETGVRATFEQGVEEPFDAVVTTTRSLFPTREPVTTNPLHTWAFEWPTWVPTPGVPTESFAERRAAFSVPLAEATRVQLVSIADTAPSTPLSVEQLDGEFGHLFARNPLPELDERGLQYSQQPRAVPTSIQAGGVALVGPAVRASVPGDCLGPTLGVEDAWVLADALAFGPPGIDGALAEYERRRRRRERELAAVVEDLTTQVPTECRPALTRLCASRRLAFSHVFDRPLPDLAQSVPDTL